MRVWIRGVKGKRMRVGIRGRDEKEDEREG